VRGNYARTKGKTGVTAEEFKIILFTTEFAIKERIGQCVKKRLFRQLAARFNSLAERRQCRWQNKQLLFEILKEDNPSQ
jgi:hypothetical protein